MPGYDAEVMARPGWLASRLILVVAVVGCMLGLGHLSCGADDVTVVATSTAGISMTADQHEHGTGHTTPTDRIDGTGGDRIHGCCADSADLGAMTAPLVHPPAPVKTAATTPATNAGDSAPVTAQPRPPDITALCVHRT
jgi:hypothetical protein